MLSFGGGQLDEDTGLIHFPFRDYDPATGFFIQQDPLGLRGGDVDVYGYCLDDPVNMVDPLGLRGKKVDLRYFKERARGLDHGFNDMISLVNMIMLSHPFLDLAEMATCRDLDSDGDSCWGADNSPDDSSGYSDARIKGEKGSSKNYSSRKK